MKPPPHVPGASAATSFVTICCRPDPARSPVTSSSPQRLTSSSTVLLCAAANVEVKVEVEAEDMTIPASTLSSTSTSAKCG